MNKFAEIYFGRKLEDLTYENVESFFSSEREESDKIEFKSFSLEHSKIKRDLDGVIRGICALTNSSGGILIWGAPEGENIDDRTEKIFIGDLSPVNERKEKDWLISKISDSITPLPIGIRVEVLEKNNQYVYVFEVDSSAYKPHQYKNTYWVRIDGQTKPAPHYLIESLFKQIKYPNIEGYIKLVRFSHDGNRYYLDLAIFIINFSELQNEENVSFRLICPQGTFTNAGHLSSNSPFKYRKGELVYNDFAIVLHFGTPMIHRDRLAFNPTTREVDFILMFGGRKSPMKSSNYRLDLSRVDLNRTNNPSYLLIEKEENKTMAEKQAELGKTREDILRSLLED